jgi:hypothetical protein
VANFTPRAFYTRENQNTYRTGGWMCPTASLGVSENRENIFPAGIRTPDRPVRGIIAIMAPEELGKSLESQSRQAVSWPRQASRTRRQFLMNAAATSLRLLTKAHSFQTHEPPCSLAVLCQRTVSLIKRRLDSGSLRNSQVASWRHEYCSLPPGGSGVH